MAADRFPYDKESSEALAILLQETRPNWKVSAKKVQFKDFIHLPKDGVPGRTFVDVVLLDQGITTQFCYRRLDIGVALGPRVILQVEGDITSRKIVDELNRVRAMQFSNVDVFVSDRILAREGEGVVYRMRARPSSPVWYGETILEVEAVKPTLPANVRLLEDGTPRLLEDGSYRLLEA